MRFVVFDDWAYRFGNFNPWVSGFVYAPEVVLWVVFFVFLFLAVMNHGPTIFGRGMPRLYILFFLFLFNLLIVSWWNGALTLGLFAALRIVEAGMVYVLLKSDLLSRRQVLWYLLAGAGIQFFIATGQFVLNRSLDLAWLGEPMIASDILGVAKRDLANGFQQIRAYGTFLHPNILAAYFLVVYWAGRRVWSRAQNFVPLQWPFFAVVLLGLYFAFSRAAFAVFLMGFCFLFFVSSTPTTPLPPSFERRGEWLLGGQVRRWVTMGMVAAWMGLNVLVFLRPVETQNFASLQARMEQMQISRAMAAEHPWGVGAGRFTLEMERFSPRHLAPWDFQPVHNVYALILNELGIQGLILVFFGIGYYVYRRSATRSPTLFLLILVLASADHFFWDSWAGMMLLPFVFFFDEPASSVHHA